MKATELIKQAQRWVDKYGDLELTVYNGKQDYAVKGTYMMNEGELIIEVNE